MYLWKPAGRREALIFITVMLLTPTISYRLLTEPTEPTTTPPEPDCKVEAEKPYDIQGYDICACDPQCARYGDCCRSSPYFVPEEQRLGASPFTCWNLPGTNLNMHAMTTCPPDWKNSDTRNRCEHPDSRYRDPLFDAPVTSLSTNTTYQNWHCAYCHGDLDAATTVIWDARFTCYGFDRSTRLPDETIAEHLSFSPLTSEWNLNISLPTSGIKSSKSTRGYIQRRTDNNNKEIHSTCSLTFSLPVMNLSLPTRSCYPNEVRRCSDSWEDAGVKAQCEAYTARVCSGRNAYRNRHCLLCNNLGFTEECYFPKRQHYPLLPSLHTLLDWNGPARKECASSEKYDPISRACRQVFI